VLKMSLYVPIWKYPDRRLTSVIPSENLKHSNDAEKNTNSTSYVKLKEIFNGIRGWWRVSFDLRSTSSYTAYGRIYRNDSAYGTERSVTSTSYVTFTEDLFFDVADRIQLYAKQYSSSAYAYVRNFRLYGDFIDVITYNTLT
jgi:hypothetical protein